MPFLIAHPGAHVGAGEEAGISDNRALDSTRRMRRAPAYKTKIAIEITAGQGSNLGYHFGQMEWIYDLVKENDRLRLCFDTEHAFAAGYDCAATRATSGRSANLTRQIGIDRVVAFHLNDSLKPFHSRVDRHRAYRQGLFRTSKRSGG